MWMEVLDLYEVDSMGKMSSLKWSVFNEVARSDAEGGASDVPAVHWSAVDAHELTTVQRT